MSLPNPYEVMQRIDRCKRLENIWVQAVRFLRLRRKQVITLKYGKHGPVIFTSYVFHLIIKVSESINNAKNVRVKLLTLNLPNLECNRCGHKWVPRKVTLPKNCPNPKCKSPYWNKPRKYQTNVKEETRPEQ